MSGTGERGSEKSERGNMRDRKVRRKKSKCLSNGEKKNMIQREKQESW